MQGAQHMKRGNRLPRQLGRDIAGDAGETEHLNVQHVPRRLQSLEILAAVVAQAKVELVPCDRFRDGVVMSVKLLRMAVRMKSVRLE